MGTCALPEGRRRASRWTNERRSIPGLKADARMPSAKPAAADESGPPATFSKKGWWWQRQRDRRAGLMNIQNNDQMKIKTKRRQRQIYDRLDEVTWGVWRRWTFQAHDTSTMHEYPLVTMMYPPTSRYVSQMNLKMGVPTKTLHAPLLRTADPEHKFLKIVLIHATQQSARSLQQTTWYCNQNWLQFSHKSIPYTVENDVAIQTHFHFNLKADQVVQNRSIIHTK